MPQPFYILLGAALTGATSYSLGRLVLRRLGVVLYRQEETGFAFLLGSACLSWIVFALGVAHLMHKGVFLAVAIAAIGLGWRRSMAVWLPPLPRAWVWPLMPGVLLFALLYVSHAMAPEMSPDGSAYHLGLVGRYYRERGFPWITTNMYANLSQGIEMLFVFAWAWGKHSAAALTHLTFLFALAWQVLTYGRRFGFPAAGLGAALLVFLSPVVGIDAASAYNDVGVAAIVFGVHYLLSLWNESRSNRLLVAVGMLCGFAFAAKYTAFLVLPYAVVWVAWKLWPARRQWAVRGVATVCCVAALWIAPWLIKNAVVVGNPVSPFFNRVFRNPYVHVAFEDDYRQQMRNYAGLRSYWDLPVELTVRGHVLCGLLGPVFLLAPLGLLAWRRKQGRRLVLAALLFASVYTTNIGTRFLIMALPFVALAMAQFLGRWPVVLATVVVAHGVSAWPDLMKIYCSEYAWRLDRILWQQALRIESEDGFLSRKWPGYLQARMIEQLTPPGSRVLTFNQTGEAYTTREVVVPYQSGEGAVLGGIQWTPLIPESHPVRRLEFAIPEVNARGIRLRQTNTGAPDHWTMNEVRVFLGDRELARSSGWRLTAWPNPWDIQDAFDNSPVTRWGTWERIRPDMFVEIRFPPAGQRLDRVTVETSSDVMQAKLELDWNAGAGWAGAIKPTETELPPPLGMRREAMAVLKSRGITHLLIHENDFGAADYHSRQEAWGIQFLAERFGSRLYAIR